MHEPPAPLEPAAWHVTLPVTDFTPQQAAELLGVSDHTLEKWRRFGFEGQRRSIPISAEFTPS